MPRFIDPLTRVSSSTTDAEFLSLRTQNLKNLPDKPQSFYEMIDGLMEMQEYLSIAKGAELMQNPFPNTLNSFKQIIKWLSGGEQYNVYPQVVPAISDYSGVVESNSVLLLRIVNGLLSTLRQDTNYKFIKLMRATIADKEFRSLKLKLDELTNSLDTTYEDAKTALDAKTAESLSSLANSTATNLTEIKTTSENETEKALEKIAVAQVMEIWNENYMEQIKYCEEKLYGNRNYGKFKKDKGNFRANFRTRAQNFGKWIWNHLIPFAPRRFWLLMVLGAASACVCFVVLSSVTTLIDADTEQTSGLVIAKMVAYIGFLLIPTIAYSSVNKSYRVYLNQLDEYKQRAVVAKTMQGMLKYIDEKEDNKDIRVNIASTAAASMFGIRNTGHLTKRGDESSLIGIIGGLIGGK